MKSQPSVAPEANTPSAADDENEQRGRIIFRLTLAALLVLLLLALLAVVDSLSGERESSDAPPYTEPVPVPPKRPIVQPVTESAPAENLPESPAEPPEAAPEITPESVPEPPPVVAPPSAAESPPAPPPVVKPPARLPERRPPAALPKAPPAAPADGATVVPPEFTAPPPATDPPIALPAPPAVRSLPEANPPRLARLVTGFLVQAGVFSSPQRAEELHARLTLHGIPSTLEARVQVGPFKTQAEAEAARKKMRALGIEGVILPPAGNRRR